MADKAQTSGITVKKADDMPEWYGQVVIKGELADYSPVRGTMIIRPYGYAIWQKIMDIFNARITALGVQNAYFPMFIPESFFKKEAEHAQGFAPEVAWVSNKDADQTDRLALRPTSETIIYDSYSRWIRSHRDLPLRLNQWCNIIRWEVKDVKLFLRSREFLWQEGHCVYATEEEVEKENIIMLKEYEDLVQNILAIPAITGFKSKMETFAGAKNSRSIEAYMPDGKFLQCGTVHNLGQGFAKAFGITYQGTDDKTHHPWQSSWGFSTRLIGSMVMQHGDDKGLVLPPNIAPTQIVIVPIVFDDTKERTLEKAAEIKKTLSGFSVHIDSRDNYTPGWKFNEWELKGVPLRIEIGPKDLEKKQVVIVRRDTGEKAFVPQENIAAAIPDLLQKIQNHLFDKAHERLKRNIVETESWDAFKKAAEDRKIIYAPFSGDPKDEEKIKLETNGVTTRCIPFDQKDLQGKKCVFSGKPATCYAFFGKGY